MATIQTMRRCRRCKANTMHLEQKPNHILHLLLTVFTAGIWLIMWLLISMFSGSPKCTQCGK